MSTSMVGITPDTLITYETKISTVNSKRIESLADYVRRVRQEKGLSTLEVERNSGNQITDGYVSQIENSYVKNVSPQKLQALAKGLGVSEEEIFAVARGKSLNEDEALDAEMAHFASRVKKLTPQNKRDFEIVWRMANDLLDKLEREQARQK